MKVGVEFFSRLREIAGASSLEVELPAAATVNELWAEICRRFPAMRDFDGSVLFGLGVEFVRRDHGLRDGDEIAVMPSVQGG